MPRGIVKWFSRKKGYGFIIYGDEELFVHYSDMEGEGYKVLSENDAVEFESEETDKGLKAVKVRKLNRGYGGNRNARNNRREESSNR